MKKNKVVKTVPNKMQEDLNVDDLTNELQEGEQILPGRNAQLESDDSGNIEDVACAAEVTEDEEQDEESGDDAHHLEATEDEEQDDDAQRSPKQRLLVAMTLAAKVEAVIFASAKPLKISEIHEILADDSVTEQDVQVTLNQLMVEYQDRCGGFGLHYIKRLGYQFQTSQAAGPIMERMFASRPRPISRAALETLTIIAYRQPVTRAEIEFIRGVDAGSIIKNLLERDLIKCVGRKEIVGRPMLFGTTDEFLKVFNLSSIKDLPPLESFQPSREAVKDALEKIDGDHDPVDIEQYIADNTSESDENGDFQELETSETSSPSSRQIQGGQLDKEEIAGSGLVAGEDETTAEDESRLSTEPPDAATAVGATSGSSETSEEHEVGGDHNINSDHNITITTTEQSEVSETEHHGTIETAKMDSPSGDSLEKGS